jgi:hypothetical protein
LKISQTSCGDGDRNDGDKIEGDDNDGDDNDGEGDVNEYILPDHTIKNAEK